MSSKLLSKSKLFGKISPIVLQICVIGIVSLALGLLSFRYFEQQSDLVRFYQSEAAGVELATGLMKSLIETSLNENLSAEGLQQVHSELRLVWASKFVQAESRERAFDTSKIIPTDRDSLSRSLYQTLQIVFERSNLILDSDFETYYLADAFFSWLPKIFYQENSLLTDLHQSKNIDIRKFCLEQFMESIRRASLQTTAQDDKLPLASRDSYFPTDLAELTLQSQFAFHATGHPDEFALHAQLLRDSALKMVDHGARKFTLRNEARINSKKSMAFWSLALSIFLWLCSLVLAVFTWRKLRSRDSSFLKIIESQEQALEKSKKLATLGEISSSIGHDIANPLSVIESSVYLLERDMDQSGPLSLDHITKIRRMISRIHGITTSMKSFLGQGSAGTVTAVDLCVVLEDLQLLLKSRLQNRRVEFVLDLTEADLIVFGSESAYVQVFVNIVNNSIDAMKDSSVKQIIVSAQKRDGFLYVQIRDSGPGVPKILQEQIFESFFTTKSSEGGTGLGLSISRKIVHGFGGDIAYLAQPDGACFELKLPAPPAPQIMSA